MDSGVGGVERVEQKAPLHPTYALRQLPGRSQGSVRTIRLLLACARGRTTSRSMLTCAGRLSDHAMESAMSSATSGS